LPPSIPELAYRLALARGTEARQELFAIGFDRERYWSMLAKDLGLQFTTDLAGARLVSHAEFLTTEAVRHATSALVEIAGETVLLRAPNGAELARLRRSLLETPGLAKRVLIVPPEVIRSFLVKHRNHVLSHYAVNRLSRTLPRFSAKYLGGSRRLTAPPTLACAAFGLLLLSPGNVAQALFLLATVLFTNSSFWKLAAALHVAVPLRVEPLGEAALPTYTVLVPLYREAAVVPELLRHLQAMRYPAAKLQIVILLEADDEESATALARHAKAPNIEVIVVPPGGPRTKPKALTYALSFAWGDCVVVFDAEDRPEPEQLRKAAAAFHAYPDLGCVQARLQPDNSGSWLARMFTLEYAANFEILLPALASWRVPLPLGGTSNHFPRRVLEAVGAWDPFNVTEDADLGIRLARFGYRAATIRSWTYEEAPVTFSQWLPQRRRWIKGWIQTSLLCVGRGVPRGLRLPLRQNLAVHGIMTGGVLGLLLYPVSFLTLGAFAATFWRGEWPAGFWEWLMLATTLGNLGLLFLASAISALRGLRATAALRLAVLIPGLVIYWGLMSVAAWQAVFQLFRSPSVWEKTVHGVARDRRTPTGAGALG
jgi:cellulose synthase/poly-beta-1,6-N-acetylglucosamine synthase-like glycosyltransferase